MKFNLNGYVRVKLTNRGREILRQQHAAFAKKWPKVKEFIPIPEIDGWSRWQMWVLMETFGPHVHVGRDNPFKTIIEIEEIN